MDRDNKIIFELFKKFFVKNKLIIISMIIIIIVRVIIETVILPNQYAKTPKLFNDFLKNNNNINFFKNLLNKNSLSQIIGLIVLGWLIITFLQFINKTIKSNVKPLLFKHVRNIFTKNLFKNEEKDIDNGEYISRMNRIIEHITTYFSLTVDIILIYFIQIFTIAIYIFSQNLLIGFILMLGIILSLTILWLQTKHIIKNALIESDNFHQKSKNLNDIVNNMENILLNNQSEKYLKKLIMIIMIMEKH